MTKKECVKAAISHKSTGHVPYNIQLTVELSAKMGEQIRKDFPNKDVEDDLKAGILNEFQATELCIGNFVFDSQNPCWWGWDKENFDPSYGDIYAVPENMPSVIRRDTDETVQKYLEHVKYIGDKYQTYNILYIYGGHWEKAYETRGIEAFLADMAGEPEFAKRLMTYIADINMEVLPKVASCPELDAVLFGSDWGTQNDLMMSPKLWHEMVAPGEQRMYDVIKSNGKDLWIHSCGCILKLIDTIVEMGVDVLNPIQPECMDLRYIKDTWGDKLTFWGGISTQKTLPYGTPEEVRKESARVIELLGENGGYITCSSQNIQTDVPYENLKALIETAKAYS